MLASRPNPSDTLPAWFRNAAKGAWDRIGGLILLTLPYADRDMEAIGPEDPKIIGHGPKFLESQIG